MTRFIIRRLLYMVVVLLATTVFIFGLSRAAGDPRYLYTNEYTTAAQWEQWGETMGLNRPLIVQYFVWLGNAARGDFGRSLNEQRDAWTMVRERMPATLLLGGAAFLLAVATGVPLGMLSSVKRGSIWDYIGRIFALIGQATPAFWMGIMLILIFAVMLDLLPSGRRGGPSSFILPAITLGWASSAGLLRLIRSSMLEVLDSEYIKLARAKGVANRSIIWKHAFKNALVAPLTYSGLMFASFITGSVVTETVFAWPGIGRLGVDAVNNNDFPVMIAVVFFFAFIYVGISLVVDILYAVLDPRIRYD